MQKAGLSTCLLWRNGNRSGESSGAGESEPGKLISGQMEGKAADFTPKIEEGGTTLGICFSAGFIEADTLKSEVILRAIHIAAADRHMTVRSASLELHDFECGIGKDGDICIVAAKAEGCAEELCSVVCLFGVLTVDAEMLDF